METKKRGTIKEHLKDVLEDDGTAEGGTASADETLADFLMYYVRDDSIDVNDDVSTLDELLKLNGIKPIGLEE
jgi:hypothetical protein